MSPFAMPPESPGSEEGRSRPASLVRRVVRGLVRATSASEGLKGTILGASSSIWYLLFLLVPTVIVLFFGFATLNTQDLSISYQHLTLNNYIRSLDPYSTVARLTLKTIVVSAAATLGSLLMAYPMAYYMARVAPERHRGLWISIQIVPFWISFVVYVYALLPWVEREGYVGWLLDTMGLGGFADWLFSNWGRGTSDIVVPALVYLWGSYMIFPVFTSLVKIDKELLEAAQGLGAGRWNTFWNITFPLSLPGVITGSILVFTSTFGAFVEPQMLGGKAGTLVGNYIYNSFLAFGNFPNGAAASMVVILATVVLIYIYALFSEETAGELGRETRAAQAAARIYDRLSSLRLVRRPTVSPDGFGMVSGPVRGRFARLFDAISERHGARLLQVFTILVTLSFYIPLVQVIVFSFNYETNIIRWSYPSLRWYAPGVTQGTEEVRALFGDPDMLSALYNSFIIGGIVTALSLLLGTPAALALARYRFRSKRYLSLMNYTSLVMPSIVMGVSILVFITLLNDVYFYPYLHSRWATGYASIIVGHVTFCIPIVIVVLVVSLKEFDRSIEEAAMNLGADEFTTFARVTLPVIKPGIVSAALLAFTFSFDELVVTTFLKGGGIETLPVIMWSTMSKKIPTPELNAVSTLIILLSVGFLLLANKVQKGGNIFRF